MYFTSFIFLVLLCSVTALTLLIFVTFYKPYFDFTSFICRVIYLTIFVTFLLFTAFIVFSFVWITFTYFLLSGWFFYTITTIGEWALVDGLVTKPHLNYLLGWPFILSPRVGYAKSLFSVKIKAVSKIPEALYSFFPFVIYLCLLFLFISKYGTVFLFVSVFLYIQNLFYFYLLSVLVNRKRALSCSSSVVSIRFVYRLIFFTLS